MSRTDPADVKVARPAKAKALLRLDKATAHKLVSLSVVVFGVTVIMLLVGELVGGTEKLQAVVEGSGVWAPLAYVGIKALTYIIAPLSGTSIELASGALFGVWVGTGLSVIGSAIGGSVNYWVARTFGRTGVAKFAGKKALRQVDATADRVGGWRALLAARIILSPIYDFVSYAAGLARVPFGQYVVITLIAGIPVNILLPFLGHASTTSKTITYVILIAAGVLFIVFGIIHFSHRRKSPTKTTGQS